MNSFGICKPYSQQGRAEQRRKFGLSLPPAAVSGVLGVCVVDNKLLAAAASGAAAACAAALLRRYCIRAAGNAKILFQAAIGIVMKNE